MTGLSGLSGISGIVGQGKRGFALANPVFVYNDPAVNSDNLGNLGPDGFNWPQGKNPVVDQYGKIIAFVQRYATYLTPVVSNDGGLTWHDPNLTGFQTGLAETGVRVALAYDKYADRVHGIFIWSDAADAGTYHRVFNIVRDVSNNITGFIKDTNYNTIIDKQAVGEPGCSMVHPTALFLDTDPTGRPHGQLVAGWGVNEDRGTGVSASVRASTLVFTNTATDYALSGWKDLAGGTSIVATSGQKPKVPATEIAYNDPGFYGAYNAHPSMQIMSDGNLAFIWSYVADGVYHREATWNPTTKWWSGLTSVSTGPKHKPGGGYDLLHEINSDLHQDTVNNRIWFGMGQHVDSTKGDAWCVHYIDRGTHTMAAGEPTPVYWAGIAHNGSFAFITGDTYWDDGFGLLVTATTLPDHDVLVYLLNKDRGVESGPMNITGAVTNILADHPYDIPVIVPRRRLESLPRAVIQIVGRFFNDEVRNHDPNIQADFSGGPYTASFFLVEVV